MTGRFTLALLLLPALLAGAMPAGRGDLNAATPAEEALAALLSGYGRMETPQTTSDLAAVLDLNATAQRERAHVRASVRLSWVIPGLGHYVNGDRRSAAGFAAAELSIGITAAVLTHLLLPAGVRRRNLNYLQSSFDEIDGRWRAVSASELIPAATVAVTTSIVRVAVRAMAARDAGTAAVRALRDGTIAP